MKKDFHTDILIIGGGVGGCAAALGATSLGKNVIMTEETDWIGGQLTSQAVPPDEHRWIESFGCTCRYRQFRNLVRQYYREHYPLNKAAYADPCLNPGKGSVSRLCHEPRVAVSVLRNMLSISVNKGLLQIKLNYIPITADVKGDRILSVTLRNLKTGETETITADYILDATELGDLLPLTKVEYITGAESQYDTNEPHAIAGNPQPDNVQAITWCFAVGFDPEGNHIIDKPVQYGRWRNYVPSLNPPWPGPLLGWIHSNPNTLESQTRILLPEETNQSSFSLWPYRRLICKDHYLPDALPHEVTLVNWPQNDYFEGNIIDKPDSAVKKYLEEARQLSLSLLYWLQTEAPRPDGRVGYPGLYMCPDIMGTDNGLAKFPYIRESRRIKAKFTITELHVGKDAINNLETEKFSDSVGIGYYNIDLHPSTGGNNYIDIPALPFQIPLGALIPVRVKNLLPACKNIGTTHITNGCYRLHPVEWNIGEVSGLLTAFCLDRKISPHKVYGDERLTVDFQNLLRAQGIELEWPRSVTADLK